MTSLRYFQKCTYARGRIDGSRLLVLRPGLMVYLDDSYNTGPNMGHFMGELPAFNLLWGHALAAAGELADTLGAADPRRSTGARRRAYGVRPTPGSEIRRAGYIATGRWAKSWPPRTISCSRSRRYITGWWMLHRAGASCATCSMS
jgi:hypothetical protein